MLSNFFSDSAAINVLLFCTLPVVFCTKCILECKIASPLLLALLSSAVNFVLYSMYSKNMDKCDLLVEDIYIYKCQAGNYNGYINGFLNLSFVMTLTIGCVAILEILGWRSTNDQFQEDGEVDKIINESESKEGEAVNQKNSTLVLNSS